MMRILVINCGSSSVKYQLIDMKTRAVLVDGLVERIGRNNPSAPDHATALQQIADTLKSEHVDAVGHRVVHGGERFSQPAIIDKAVCQAIADCCDLAPLHNPASLVGIEQLTQHFADAPHVAVFDTAFHQTMPDYAFRYALPEALYRDQHIRRYGFHGTSHHFVAKEAARLLDQPLETLNLITIHLGNGASMAAIEQGRSVDTTMGVTPLEGLMMGTRTGDLDAAIPLLLLRNSDMTVDDVDELLNERSGLRGVAGSHDVRDLLTDGGHSAELALNMMTYRIKKYIGAYLAVLGHTDAIIFTGGIGENAAPIRTKSCSQLQNFGILLDDTRNSQASSAARAIHSADSAIAVFVIPTNEALEIAEQVMQTIHAQTMDS